MDEPDVTVKKLPSAPAALTPSLAAVVAKYPKRFQYHLTLTRSPEFLSITSPLLNMQYLGTVNRHVKYSALTHIDQVFNSFLQSIQHRDAANDSLYARALPQHRHGYKSIKKYDRVHPVVDPFAFNLSFDFVSHHFSPYLSSAKLVSFEYVIECMNKQTSPGSPWTLWHRTKSQALLDPEVLSFVGRSWKNFTVTRQFLLWMYNNKEEIRSKKKIAEDSLRGFTGADITQVICCDVLCRNMNELFYASVHHTWNAVGICKYHRGWHHLYTRLSKHPYAFELDISSYDAIVFRSMLYGMADFRFMMYAQSERTRDNWNRLWNIYQEIVDSLLVCTSGEVVQKFTGNPSGSSNTIVDNTIVLYRLLAYAWVVSYKKDWHPPMVYVSLRSFEKHVEAALGGDDNTFTVDDAVVLWFNARNIVAIWSDMQIMAHAPHDMGEMSLEPKALIDCHFFSMSFVRVNDTIVPVPDREKMIASMLFAGRNVSKPIWSLLRACALRIETFYDLEMRDILSRYIRYLLTHYKAHFELSVDPTLDQVMSVYKTDVEIMQLYFSLESGTVSDKHALPNKKLLSIVELCVDSFDEDLILPLF